MWLVKAIWHYLYSIEYKTEITQKYLLKSSLIYFVNIIWEIIKFLRRSEYAPVA